MEQFYLICPIGLESYMHWELTQKWPKYFAEDELSEIKIDKGGIEISCKRKQGFYLNQILRTPSKILWRLKKRKCRDIPRLYQIIKKHEWRDYLNQTSVEIKVSAKESRLFHSGKIEKAAHDAINDYFKAQSLKKSLQEAHKDDSLQTIHLRLFQDELTISLDTSGELLHKREDDRFKGLASLRENIAQLLIIALTKDLNEEIDHFIDPMCGSGTFLFERKNQNELLNRDFAYQYLAKQMSVEVFPLKANKVEVKEKLLGFELQENIVSKLKDESIKFSQQDLFAGTKVNGNNIVIINPPYGKRVKIKGDKLKYFEDIISKCEQLYAPKAFGIIIPRDFVGNIKGERISFNQNGIPVTFLIRPKAQ